jgi:saccharopine dehydrogenase (NADP+, L-glutamate forming)
MDKIKWTGILDPVPIGLPDSSPAKILQHKLEQKWSLKKGDKDMIIMIHRFKFRLNKIDHSLQSLLVVKGDDSVYTAMAKTVGLPLGMVAGLILNGKLKLTGVHLPVMKEVYEPVLRELETVNISFSEEEQ